MATRHHLKMQIYLRQHFLLHSEMLSISAFKHASPPFLGCHFTSLDLDIIPSFPHVWEHDPQCPQWLYVQSHLYSLMVTFNFITTSSSFFSSISSAWAVLFRCSIVSSSLLRLSVLFKEPMVSAIPFKTSNCSNFSWRHSRIYKKQDQTNRISHSIVYLWKLTFSICSSNSVRISRRAETSGQTYSGTNFSWNSLIACK